MIKFLLGITLIFVTVGAGSWWLWSLAYSSAERKADTYCHSLHAEPVYTHYAHAICVTSDGRVVGHL